MYNSGMGPYATALAALARKIKEEDARKLKENNGVIVSNPPAFPEPDYTYHNTITVCGQPASLDPEDTYNGTTVSTSPELMNYQTITSYGPPPSAYTVVTNVRGPATPPNLDFSYHNAVTVCGQTASLDPVDHDNGMSVLPPSEMINYQAVTGYGPPPSAYTVVTYERSKITLYSPISPAESDTDSASSSESSDSPGSEPVQSTPVKQSAPNYMLEPYIATPTTSEKRIRRRHLNFRDPNLMYDLEDISEDESDSGEPLAQKSMADDDVADNEAMRAWINAIANLHKSKNE